MMTTNEPPCLFAIGDLHLPGGMGKPMDVFGLQWEAHFDRIAAHWRSAVSENDIVLIPGDISWAMHLRDAMEDLRAIAALPGRKILIRGNHDYWWGSISQLRSALPEGMYALQNDAVVIDGIAFSGSRGWTQPTGPEDQDNAKLYARELMRMELSLQAARRQSPLGPLVALTHFPPTDAQGSQTPMTELFSRYAVSDVVYGHLHDQAADYAFSGSIHGVRYHFVSCDGLDFKLCALPEARGGGEALI